MCQGCWAERGSPLRDDAETRAAAEAIRQVYEHSDVGGNLHIVVDDWNLEDGFLEFCEESILGNFHELPPEAIEAERRCLALLRALDVDGRASALAIYEGFTPTA